MSPRTRSAVLLCVLATTVACAADPASVPCGTEEDPAELRITKRSPALQASVKNLDIEETFTVGDSPIDFSVAGILDKSAEHTAGYVVDGLTSWGHLVSGRDVTFVRFVPSWSYAPAHVEYDAIAGWVTEGGCYYKLPTPVLSYDVVP
jgi:hypothetical protein